tara:strand:+ start:17 stop:595 length:579 start_codon:yes stop_codon:yes gene_type:complete
MARRKNVKRINPRYFLNEKMEYGRNKGGKYGMEDVFGVVDLRQLYGALPEETKQEYLEYAERPADDKPIGDLSTPEEVFKWSLRANLFGRDGARLETQDPVKNSSTMIAKSGGVGGRIADKRSLISAIERFMNGVGARGVDVASAVRDTQEASFRTQMATRRGDEKYQVSSASPLKETTDILNNFKKFLTEG